MVNFMPRGKSRFPIRRVLMNLSSDSSVLNLHSLDDIGVWDQRCLPANTPLQFLTVMPMFFFILTTSHFMALEDIADTQLQSLAVEGGLGEEGSSMTGIEVVDGVGGGADGRQGEVRMQVLQLEGGGPRCNGGSNRGRSSRWRRCRGRKSSTWCGGPRVAPSAGSELGSVRRCESRLVVSGSGRGGNISVGPGSG
jgi:hypothetical protein